MDVRVIASLLRPPASPLMSLKSCNTSTCIAGSAKKPTADRSAHGSVVMYQRGLAYRQWMQPGSPAVTSMSTGGSTPAAMPQRTSLAGDVVVAALAAKSEEMKPTSGGTEMRTPPIAVERP